MFDLARRARADHVRFNIETKITPESGADVADPETFAAAVVREIRKAGLQARVSIQSFEWRTLAAAGRMAPEIARSCITVERQWHDNLQRGGRGASPWSAGLDIDDFESSVPRLVKAAGCAVWSPMFQDLSPVELAEAKSIGLKVVPWTVNERPQMERLIRAASMASSAITRTGCARPCGRRPCRCRRRSRPANPAGLRIPPAINSDSRRTGRFGCFFEPLNLPLACFDQTGKDF